MFQIVINFLKH